MVRQLSAIYLNLYKDVLRVGASAECKWKGEWKPTVDALSSSKCLPRRFMEEEQGHRKELKKTFSILAGCGNSVSWVFCPGPSPLTRSITAAPGERQESFVEPRNK